MGPHASTAERVALGYLELGLAGAALLTLLILALLFLRWGGKQREADRQQFSEQLQAEREDVKDERQTHLQIAQQHREGMSQLAQSIMDQTGAFQIALSEQRKDFTDSMQVVTRDQIELAKLRAIHRPPNGLDDD